MAPTPSDLTRLDITLRGWTREAPLCACTTVLHISSGIMTVLLIEQQSAPASPNRPYTPTKGGARLGESQGPTRSNRLISMHRCPPLPRQGHNAVLVRVVHT
eukprot:scaffold3362_cov402-Prasinococcus_capsulatus_cf.AAC.7